MSRKVKIFVAVVCAAGTAALAGTATPAADAQAPFACPPGGWFLATPIGDDVVVDRNGDGLICVKSVPGRGSSRCCPGFTIKDDLYFLED